MEFLNNAQEGIPLDINQMDAKLSPIKQMDNTNNIFIKIHKNQNLMTDEIESKRNEVYKQRVVKAFRQREIFSIYGNNNTVRKALIKRGWIEKYTAGRLQKLQKLSCMKLLKGARKDNDYENAILSKFLQPYPPNLIWQPKYFKDQYIECYPLRNRVRRMKCLDFSTKVGLIGCFGNSHWNTVEDIAQTTYMPSYKLNGKEDELYFQDEFRITQCISILTYLNENMEPKAFDKLGEIPISVIEFPINNILQQINALEQDHIYMTDIKDDFVQWEHFAANIQMLKKNEKKIVGSESDFSYYIIKIQETLKKATVFRPFLSAYGCRNLWILKPGFQCRGQGILIMDNFYSIINYAAKKSKLSYVVQKYIERPFLIYKTKFDIRQYMLLTVFDVISIWMYRDCYLRFSSREFNLDDLREEVHITNNSIQKKYKNHKIDQRLPQQNMWELVEFLRFLNEAGESEAWQSKIYPGLKKNIIGVVLSSLEGTELTPNSFEIYGCDFMLDEYLNTFLIEINSTPDMSPSTSVTAKMCPLVIEDLFKVILDHSKNPKMSTGRFELIYQTPCPRNCNNTSDLIVSGKAKKINIPVCVSKEEKKARKKKKTIK